jgi:hypothetical protein
MVKEIKNSIQLNKVSIGLHLNALSFNEFSKINNVIQNHEVCKTFNSYEKDLFSFRFEEKPPYRSKLIKSVELNICFENEINFRSEGRAEEWKIMDSRFPLKAKAFLSEIFFFDSNLKIFQVVFSPLNSLGFSEFEIIQFCKLFTGKQEEYQGTIKFSLDDNDFNNLIELVKYITHYDGILELPQAGTIQLDTSDLIFISNENFQAEIWAKFYSGIYEIVKNNSIVDLEILYNKNEEIRYFLNFICGLSLGIFDFSRMTFEEVVDTIIPIQPTKNSFLVLNKNSILSVCHGDKLLDATIENGIGISPYLLIANSVLTSNAYWAKESEDKISAYNSKKRLSEKKEVLTELEEIEKCKFLPNVFQYPTEKEIYQIGTSNRGTFESIEFLRVNIATMNKEIEDIYSKRNNTISIVSISLTLISIVQLHEFLENLIQKKVSFFSLFILGSFILMILSILIISFFRNR